MASSDSTAPAVPLSAKKENGAPLSSKIAELNESRSELLNRIQSLKQDMQSWRSKLDTQVKFYHEELSELKKTLNVEVEQLRSEFQDLRTTLHQQQEDVTASLRNLGLQDVPGDSKQAESQASKIEEIDQEEEQVLPKEKDDNGKVAEK